MKRYRICLIVPDDSVPLLQELAQCEGAPLTQDVEPLAQGLLNEALRRMQPSAPVLPLQEIVAPPLPRVEARREKHGGPRWAKGKKRQKRR